MGQIVSRQKLGDEVCRQVHVGDGEAPGSASGLQEMSGPRNDTRESALKIQLEGLQLLPVRLRQRQAGGDFVIDLIERDLRATCPRSALGSDPQSCELLRRAPREVLDIAEPPQQEEQRGRISDRSGQQGVEDVERGQLDHAGPGAGRGEEPPRATLINSRAERHVRGNEMSRLIAAATPAATTEGTSHPLNRAATWYATP